MARIDSELIEAIRRRLGGTTARTVYRRIEEKVRETYLDRHHAALVVAAEAGVNIARYGTAEDRAALRQYIGRSGGSASESESARPPPLQQPGPPLTRRSRPPGRSQRRRGERDKIFVIHGRNTRMQGELHAFLRAVGLDPIEWNQALRLSRRGSAHVSEIVGAAFNKAEAFVVLLTPDDEAQLRREFWKRGEEAFEKRLTPQARPNVLFEAGMAFGLKPDATVVVQFGKVRPFSDVVGRHVLHLNNTPQKRKEFIAKLQAAGCRVDESGTDWMNAGDFTLSR